VIQRERESDPERQRQREKDRETHKKRVRKRMINLATKSEFFILMQACLEGFI